MEVPFTVSLRTANLKVIQLFVLIVAAPIQLTHDASRLTPNNLSNALTPWMLDLLAYPDGFLILAHTKLTLAVFSLLLITEHPCMDAT